MQYYLNLKDITRNSVTVCSGGNPEQARATQNNKPEHVWHCSGFLLKIKLRNM